MTSVARRPVRHKPRLNFLGSPVRPAAARPACVSRMPARKFTEKQANVKWERGFESGLEIGHVEARLELVEAYLHGGSLDLMTRKELESVALGLVTMASEVTRKRLEVPLEPYLRPPGDWDIDVDLDDEDGES